MSISQPPLLPASVDPSAWNLGSRQAQTLHDRRLNKKRRLEAKYQRKQKGDENTPYTPFFVPEEILIDGSDSSNGVEHTQPQSLLLTILPTELFLLVVEHLSIPYFQVSLALTCKRIATILAQNRIRISPWRGYWDKEGLYRLLTQQERPLSSSAQYPRPRTKQRNLSLDGLSLQEQQHLPLTRSSTVPLPVQSQPYIPTTYRLCRACFRHVPRDPIYWQSRMRSKEYDAPGVNWFDITNFFEEGYRNCGQHKCPDCCVRGYVAFMNEGAYEKAAKEDARDEGWGIDLDAEEKGRRVCPGLAVRLGRP